VGALRMCWWTSYKCCKLACSRLRGTPKGACQADQVLPAPGSSRGRAPPAVARYTLHMTCCFRIRQRSDCIGCESRQRQSSVAGRCFMSLADRFGTEHTSPYWPHEQLCSSVIKGDVPTLPTHRSDAIRSCLPQVPRRCCFTEPSCHPTDSLTKCGGFVGGDREQHKG
jgi:hypothetical protein